MIVTKPDRGHLLKSENLVFGMHLYPDGNSIGKDVTTGGGNQKVITS